MPGRKVARRSPAPTSGDPAIRIVTAYVAANAVPVDRLSLLLAAMHNTVARLRSGRPIGAAFGKASSRGS